MKALAVLFAFALSLSSALSAEPKPISVAVGQEFKLSLESNASTGNQWLIARPLDEQLVKLLGTEYKRGRPGNQGGTGNEVLSFKALAEGRTHIHLKYGKLFERDAVPARTTNFVVVITRSAH
jgi:predicted secreted protein